MITSTEHASILDPATGRLKSYPFLVSNQTVEAARFAADSKGNVFFSQYGNLYRFNDREGAACILERTSGASGVLGLFIDRSDVLWAGTIGSGIYKFNLKASLFYPRPYRQDFHTDVLKYGIGLPEDQLPAFPAEASPYNFRYAPDGQGRIWFNVGSNPCYRVDPATSKITKIPLPFPLDNKYSPSPVPLAADPEGRVWALHDSLVVWYDEPRKKWESFPHLLRFPGSGKEPRNTWNSTHRIHFVVDETALWVITDNKGMYRIDRRTGAQQHYLNDPSDPGSLSSNLLYCIFQDPDEPDILWVGTFGAGLCRFNKRTGKARTFNTRDGLPNNVVYAAIPDRNGKIWIATNRGLCRMDRKTSAKRTFTREDGLIADEFNRFHFLHLPDDRILLGGIEGITSFYPEEILDDSFQPEVEITGIRVNNQAVEPGPSSLIDSLSLQQLTELRLEHSQNSLSIEFAGLQYNSFKSIGYRFQLEGLDKDWVQAKRGEATYTNLDPGTYLLKLNTSNTTGAWSPHVRTLSVVISPPWWANPWAYLAYFIAAVYLGYALIRLYIKEKEAQHLRTVDELKTRFFSNITHDFRTPLTLILGPVRQLKASAEKQKAGHSRRQLDTIERNAEQLLQLVNQLLDLSKLEAGPLQVETVRENLMNFTRQLILSFQSQADEKGIRLAFESSGVDRDYNFDAGKLERILYNLVANALKFTGKGGKIEVSLAGAEDGINIKVADTGCGIPAGKLPYIFDRFYQADPAHNFHEQGTGIGLSLVKELVELQEGRISVSSAVGKGTVFSLRLPCLPAATGEILSPETPKEVDFQAKTIQNDTATPNILIVEDNPELAAYISDSLPATYKIALAGNGRDGWEAALSTSPDLIISDVMMPVMDGFGLCKEIKEDIRTSHIPVILLTAKVSHENRIEGLSYGADDYIAKPFHMEELQLKVKNILEHSKKYRDWVQSQLIGHDVDITRNQAEEINPFLKKVFDLLEANLDNTSFGIDHLIDELGMSRMTLFRKVKVLTGYATGDLIRNYRLNRAKEFLKEGYTISETAYKVGFNSLAYFSKCFRDLYGMTPSEFVRKHR